MAFQILKIDNSKDAAVKSGTWSNPGAAFYDTILNSMYSKDGTVPDDTKEYEKRLKNGSIGQYDTILKEAYLIAPVSEIHNSPHGRTPYSQSGCKYPHHVIRNGTLVVSIPELKAAYSRAKQQGIFKGAVKEHLERHYKELGLYEDSTMTESMIQEGIDAFEERSHGTLKYDFRKAYDFDTGHGLKLVYSLDGIQIDRIGHGYFHANGIEETDDSQNDAIQKVQRGIKTKGNMDHSSHGQKLLAIVDRVTGERLTHARIIGPFAPAIPNRVLSILNIDDIHDYYTNKHPELLTKYVHDIKVGDVDMQPQYKATHWFNHDTSTMKLRNGIAIKTDNTITRGTAAESLLYGRGAKINDISADRPVAMVGSGVKYNHPSRKDVKKHPELYGKESAIHLGDDALQSTDREIFTGPLSHMEWKLEENFSSIISYLEKADPKLKELTDKEKEKLAKADPDSYQNNNEDLVPIFGILKSYSMSKFRSDGTPKPDSEISSIKFKKFVKLITRGDNYSHALISFDSSLKEMYSFDSPGIVVDGIDDVESWKGTDSIYICVMFIPRADKMRIKRLINLMIKHKDNTVYGFGNMIRAYISKPIKQPYQYICSSFVGFLMACSNPKNLHRDYSRFRPEDISILPRAFYVTNVTDYYDLKKRQPEIDARVNKIFTDHKEEIMEYNNELPKLFLKEKMGKLKSWDRLFDAIIKSFRD